MPWAVPTVPEGADPAGAAAAAAVAAAAVHLPGAVLAVAVPLFTPFFLDSTYYVVNSFLYA